MPDADVLALLASGLAVGAVSAVSPVLPVEAYVAAVALARPTPTALAAAVAAGIGQTLGKTALLAATRSAGRSRWTRRLRERAHRRAAAAGPPDAPSATTTHRARLRARAARLSRVALDHLGGRAGPLVVLLSAALGVPPLLLVTVVAGASPMTYRAFVPACLLGRTVRFCALALLPGLTTGRATG
ncbi:hypothetical protein [uncultured Pseudokineococcus sp.]|uniref:hypothetical protein n=1 Tax=uncultured Pseudokineococcus sp. TaxID=1642928 RepID=UPI0026313C99|nr:hypothetical protein [uncultured Pseudokineococcus sp.]